MIQAQSAFTTGNLRSFMESTEQKASQVLKDAEQQAQQILAAAKADADELRAQAADLRAVLAELAPPPQQILEAKRTPLDGPPPPADHRAPALEGAST